MEGMTRCEGSGTRDRGHVLHLAGNAETVSWLRYDAANQGTVRRVSGDGAWDVVQRVEQDAFRRMDRPRRRRGPPEELGYHRRWPGGPAHGVRPA